MFRPLISACSKPFGRFLANPANWTTLRTDATDADADAVVPHGRSAFFPFGVMATFRGAALCTFAFIGIEMLMHSQRDSRRSVSYMGALSLAMIFASLSGCAVVLTLMWPPHEMV